MCGCAQAPASDKLTRVFPLPSYGVTNRSLARVPSFVEGDYLTDGCTLFRAVTTIGSGGTLLRASLEDSLTLNVRVYTHEELSAMSLRRVYPIS